MEMMVVIAIIGIVSSIAVYTYMSGNPERRVRGASRDLYAGFKQASSQAVNRSLDVTITFTLGAIDSYTITDANGPIANNNFPDFIDLYKLSANTFVYNSRGMLTGASGSVLIRYGPNTNAATRMGVSVTSAGGISLVDETMDTGQPW